MRIGIVSLMALSLVAACATRPAAPPAPSLAPPPPVKPYYTEDVLVVAMGDAIKFWMVDDPSKLIAGAKDQPGNGCFRMQVIIDSNGNLFSPKTLAMVGSPKFYQWVPQLLAKLHYHPTKENTNRTPIQTTLEWTFTTSVNTSPFTEADSRRRLAEGPPPEAQKFIVTCKADMDKQMGVAPTQAPAAATVH